MFQHTIINLRYVYVLIISQLFYIVLSSEVLITNHYRYRDFHHFNIYQMYVQIYGVYTRLVILHCCEMILTHSFIWNSFILKSNIEKIIWNIIKMHSMLCFEIIKRYNFMNTLYFMYPKTFILASIYLYYF